MAAQNVLVSAIADLRQRPRGNVPCLDILRSAAILLVFSAHVGGNFSSIVNVPFIYWGWTGVDLFYVLSGYLIGGQLWKELNRTGTIRVGRFILRRGFRIWPLYYAILLITFVVALIKAQTLNSFWTDLFFLSNYTERTNVAGGWSLSTEEQFYITFPLVLWLGSRYASVKGLALVPVMWLIALPLIRARTTQPLGGPFHTHSDGLAVGLLIAWLAVFYPQYLKAPFWKNALVLFGLVVLALFLRNVVSRHMFAFSSLGLFYGGIALFLLRLPNPPAWFNWSGFYVISRLSYGIYLIHFWVLDHTPLTNKLHIGNAPVGFLLLWFVALFVSATMAFVTFAVIELPFLRIRETYLSKPRAVTAS